MMKVNTTEKPKANEAAETALTDAQLDALMKDMGLALGKAARISVLLPKLPEEDNVVEVCINGYTLLIPRGLSLELPEPVAEVLRTSGLI